MATASIVVAIISLIFASLASNGVSAPALSPASVGAPSPEGAGAAPPSADVCLAAITNMSDCLTFVEDGSKLKKPDKGCCPELAGLVDSNPICLCQLLGNSDSIGIKIDNNKALKLPSICGVPTPPVTTCSAVGVPVSLPPSMSGGSMSPNMAPKGSAPSPSNAAADSSGSPSPASRSSDSEHKNGASVIKSSDLTFICVLSIFFISIFF